jgi:hypothetical protein
MTLHTPETLRLQAKLDRLALEQLRAECARLNDELEATQRELYHAQESADFWQNYAEELRQSLGDSEANHLCVGLTRAGEMLVIEKPAQARANQ